eukprot:3675181-Amphidinium_carterae.1
MAPGGHVQPGDHWRSARVCLTPSLQSHRLHCGRFEPDPDGRQRSSNQLLGSLCLPSCTGFLVRPNIAKT